MHPALILLFFYVAFVIWKLTPVVFRALEIRKQRKADEEILRIDREHKQDEEDAVAKKKANDEWDKHEKRMMESISHGGRVQYPWVSGIRGSVDPEFTNVRAEIAKRDREAKRRGGIQVTKDMTTEKELFKKAVRKLFEEEGP